MNIPLSRPDITESEINCVSNVLRTPNLSLGPKLLEFEEKMAMYVGTKHAIAVNSGTSGLHIILKSFGIKKGDKVITPPFSFIASANAILFVEAEPVFVDIDENTLNIDPENVEEVIVKEKSESARIKAILLVHVFGQPCEMDKIMQIAKKHDIVIVEDACEALGAEYGRKTKLGHKELSNKDSHVDVHTKSSKSTNSFEWRKVGAFGKAGVFGFYPNKQMTTGEGGIVVTDDENIEKLCKSLRNQGRKDDSSWLIHERLGYNYRISDINCALGIVQLGRLEEMLLKRENIANMYNERLRDIKEVQIPFILPNVKMSWFVYVIRLGKQFSRMDRDKILYKLREKGIECSNYFSPIHLQPFYRKMFGYKEGDFPITEHSSERTIALPFFNNMSEKEVEYVVRGLKDAISSI
ncbi:MAG: aminotransferase arnB [Candidatus Scalindua rubra]|uniref:Aminotransferase arnB n=1 Tax=Candidatus Scalindua rubra TaxID=1872076 RepID=A0A1E3XDH5_9BACT|nr:MAG: aminotransferase arnB [Candidatus Scalindua rubra]